MTSIGELKRNLALSFREVLSSHSAKSLCKSAYGQVNVSMQRYQCRIISQNNWVISTCCIDFQTGITEKR